MIRELKAIYVVLARELIKFRREKSKLISALARPLLWLFLIGAGMSRIITTDMEIPYIQFIFPGIIGMTVLFSSIFSSISIIWDKEFGFMKEMLVAPISRYSIVFGKALSGSVISTIQALFILSLFPFIGLSISLSDFLSALAIAFLISFCLSAFGILITTFYESFESFSVIMNFIVMPMFFLSGAMYPVSILPDGFRHLTYINPLTYGVDALKYKLLPIKKTLTHDFPFAADMMFVICAALFFVVAASICFERKKD